MRILIYIGLIILTSCSSKSNKEITQSANENYPEEVAIKFMTAMFKKDIKTAYQYVSDEFSTKIVNEDKSDEDDLGATNVRTEVISKKVVGNKVCYKLKIYFTLNGESRHERENCCVKMINGEWKVVK